MANYLLDTCTFIWIAWDAPELSDPARSLFRDPANQIFLSAASSWEVAVKHDLGKLALPGDPAQLVPEMRSKHRIEPLDVDEESALRLGSLPRLHRDPFDRMLICQAISNGMAIVTPDQNIRQYPIKTAW